MVLAILDLGNLDFDDKKHQTNESNPCEISNKTELQKISKMLGVSMESLEKMLLFEKKVILKEVTYKPYSKIGCFSNRNTLSKSLYNSIFEFIIYKVQLALSLRNKDTLSSINLLDIFGF